MGHQSWRPQQGAVEQRGLKSGHRLCCCRKGGVGQRWKRTETGKVTRGISQGGPHCPTSPQGARAHRLLDPGHGVPGRSGGRGHHGSRGRSDCHLAVTVLHLPLAHCARQPCEGRPSPHLADEDTEAWREGAWPVSLCASGVEPGRSHKLPSSQPCSPPLPKRSCLDDTRASGGQSVELSCLW